MFVSEATAEEKAAAVEQRRRVAALAAGGALVVSAGRSEAGDVTLVPAAPLRAAAAAKILAALVAFYTAQRARARGWLREQLRKRAQSVAPDEIERVLDEEERRGAEFERKAAERLAGDLASILAIPDRAQREAALAGLTKREERYARQRNAAMAARAVAAVERIVVRQQSPSGAFWRLDPTVKEHTAGCLIMGGKFWPWAVLDRVHPPRHAGCPCRLISYAQAVAEGLMRPGDVMDAAKALRAAAAVVMEGAVSVDPEDGVALIEAAYGSVGMAMLRQELISRGMATADQFDEQLAA